MDLDSGATLLVARVDAADGAEACAGGGLGGGEGTLECRFSWSYLRMTLSHFCPRQPLAHTPVVVFYSDRDCTKADAEDAEGVA